MFDNYSIHVHNVLVNYSSAALNIFAQPKLICSRFGIENKVFYFYLNYFQILYLLYNPAYKLLIKLSHI